MTALLTADEAARLRPGEQLVIVRAGDPWATRDPDGYGYGGYNAPQDWVALTGPCPTCERTGIADAWVNGPGDVTLLLCPDCRDGRRIVPLYTECPTCHGSCCDSPCLAAHPDDGRPHNPCPTCGRDGFVLVGQGSIEVVPVVAGGEQGTQRGAILVYAKTSATFLYASDGDYKRLVLDPLPVPGHDWGIVIDCVEAAHV